MIMALILIIFSMLNCWWQRYSNMSMFILFLCAIFASALELGLFLVKEKVNEHYSYCCYSPVEDCEVTLLQQKIALDLLSRRLDKQPVPELCNGNYQAIYCDSFWDLED